MQFEASKNGLRVHLFPSCCRSILWLARVALAPLICLISAHAHGADAEFQWANAYPLAMQGNMTEAEADHLGNIYSLGNFQGTIDADAGAGTQNLTSHGQSDLILVKSDSGGNFIWAFQIGGSGREDAAGLEIDAVGDIYIGLQYNAAFDADPGPGITTVTTAGSVDMGILKFDSDGNLIYARTIGGTGADIVNSVIVDAGGNVHFSGYTESSTIDLDPGAGTHTVTNAGSLDTVVVKLDPNGDFAWGYTIGGTGLDRGISLAVATNGEVYFLTAIENTVDFDPGVGTFPLVSGGGHDQALVKFNSAGDFQWAFAISGPGDSEGGFVALDPSDDNVYISGNLRGTADFDPSACTSNLSSAGDQDAFIAKYDSNGGFIWAKRAGGSSDDHPRGLTVDSAGNSYSSGQFKSTPADFDPGPGTLNLSSSGGVDGFLWSLDSSGDLRWAKRFGGSDNDLAMKPRLAGSSELLLTGTYQGTADLDPGPGSYTPPAGGSSGSPYLVNLLLLGDPNSAPTADAGGDVTIHWTEQPFTAVLGQGFDAEGDDLTYSWSDVTGCGSILLLPSTPTGLAGEADLDLGLLPLFPLGPSTLQLDVSDEQKTDSDRMVLTLTNSAPTANAGGNLMILTSEQASTILQGVASDTDEGDSLSYRWVDVTGGGSIELLPFTPAGQSGEAPLDLGALPPLSLGAHDLLLEVTDGAEFASNPDRTMVLTVGNSPPNAVLIGCGTYSIGSPILIGGSVSDINGGLIDWEIVEGFDVLASGQVLADFGGDPVLIPDTDLSSVLGLGVHSLTLKVSDGINPDASDSCTVTVIDNDDPTLAPIPSISQLWPPNHTLVPVTIEVNSDDNSGGPITLSVSLMSDEPVDGTADGNTEPDVIIVGVVDGPGGFIDLLLRSERQGKGDGRTYTITIVAEDSSGNTSSAQVQIIAPHDKGKK